MFRDFSKKVSEYDFKLSRININSQNINDGDLINLFNSINGTMVVDHRDLETNRFIATIWPIKKTST